MISASVHDRARVLGYYVGRGLGSGTAWNAPTVVGGAVLQQGKYIAVRRTGGAAGVPHSVAAWLAPRGSLIAFSSPSPSSPIRHLSCSSRWMTGDGAYGPAIPSAVRSFAEHKGGFNLWDPNGTEYTHWGDLENYGGGARCWIEWPSALWHLWAENATLSTTGGRRAFDFSRAVLQWHKATPGGSLASVPAQRPFDWPDGPSAQPSYLASHSEDMAPDLGAGGTRVTLGGHVGLNGGGWYVIPDPLTTIGSSFIDTSKYSGGIITPQPRTSISSPSSTDQNKRTAGTYWDWSSSPATERYLFWQATDAGHPDLSGAGLPERLFTGQNLPPDGTAFDLNFLFEVHSYSILRADRYVDEVYQDETWDPDTGETILEETIYYDLAPAVVSSDTMDILAAGTLSQLVPVAPKARA